MTHSMTIPLWVMLGFAGWTLAVLTASIGVYRWSRILPGARRLPSGAPMRRREANGISGQRVHT